MPSWGAKNRQLPPIQIAICPALFAHDPFGVPVTSQHFPMSLARVMMCVVRVTLRLAIFNYG